MIFSLISSLFILIAIVCFFNLNPQQITEDVVKFFSKKENIRDTVHMLRAGKKKKSIGQKLLYIKDAMTAMGKGEKFGFIICLSLILFAAGAVAAVLINNLFLVPAFAVAFAVIPFIYIKNSMYAYEKHIKDELETTLSIISTSYARSEDIIGAVKENLTYIKPPLREYFTSFISDAAYISNTKQALKNLKKKVDDDIFAEWCDALLQCQDDSTLKDNLQSIVAKLTDVRIVNNELSAMMASVRIEYYTMVGLVAGNIPLLYILNKDWFHTLLFELPGKITLGICGAVILVTYLFMLKFTKPVEYKN